MRNIILALAISMFLGAFAINFALADVTGAGSTTNTQSTTGTITRCMEALDHNAHELSKGAGQL